MPNLKSIHRKVQNSRGLSRKLDTVMRGKFQKQKERLLNDFDFHPVTKEILGGPDAENVSGTLLGYGNLFSFIGFEDGSNPTFIVRAFLDEMTKISRSRKTAGNKVGYDYKVRILDLQDFRSIAPLPWEAGRSWVEGIERGISGLGFYINNSRSGRSGGGIQAKNKIRAMGFKNIKYMSEMIRNFTKNVRKIK